MEETQYGIDYHHFMLLLFTLADRCKSAANWNAKKNNNK